LFVTTLRTVAKNMEKEYGGVVGRMRDVPNIFS
jgi:hypothetical protein